MTEAGRKAEMTLCRHANYVSAHYSWHMLLKKMHIVLCFETRAWLIMFVGEAPLSPKAQAPEAKHSEAPSSVQGEPPKDAGQWFLRWVDAIACVGITAAWLSASGSSGLRETGFEGWGFQGSKV